MVELVYVCKKCRAEMPYWQGSVVAYRRRNKARNFIKRVIDRHR